MPYTNELRQRIRNAPIGQLEFIYNHCWRNQHNDIDKDINIQLMSMIESVANERDILITGQPGWYEFHQEEKVCLIFLRKGDKENE